MANETFCFVGHVYFLTVGCSQRIHGTYAFPTFLSFFCTLLVCSVLRERAKETWMAVSERDGGFLYETLTVRLGL